MSALEPLQIELKDAQQRVARLFRYGQVGQCVNSVTHDINNLLGAIIAYAELIAMHDDVSAESQRMLNEIISGVRKCNHLVTCLTAIARPEQPNVSVADPGTLMEHMLLVRQYDFRLASVKLDVQYDDSLPTLAVDQPRLELALLYLINNALEEAGTRADKHVSVRVVRAADGVAYEVCNAGGPIAEAAQERMFDYFYSTKDSHHLGMGLPIAREIARQHSGELTYDAARGFVLQLPNDTGIRASF